jgi:cellulose synthase/poly-beta-1,6-N-acetylglucosamine synthase-like glycosyltransferase
MNLVSQTVEVEYYLINFLLRKSKFKQFNGLIGVLRAEHLMKYRLNENAITEDADFATRMHCLGYRAILVDGIKIYEQAPLSWKDLVSQRKRWYYGGLQLWKYWRSVKATKNLGFILSWLSALTITYMIVLFVPLLILAPPLLLYKFRSFKKVLVTFGLLIHAILLQYSAICAIAKYIRGRGMEWSPIKRVPQ